MATRAWPRVIRQKVLQPAGAQAAGHLLLGRVGVAQAGRHRQVDERVDRERHHQHRAPEAGHRGAERGPAEADHEVGDGQRHHDEHRPDPPAGQVGALDQPGRAGADHRAQHRHHDGQPDGVPQQLGGQRAVDQRSATSADARALRLDQQEDQRQQDQRPPPAR